MSPRLPRDINAQALIKALKALDYEPTRQAGSHIRLTTKKDGEFHVTIPNHDPLRVGTFSNILNAVGNHHKLSRNELLLLLKL